MPTIKRGGVVRFDEEEVDKWLKNRDLSVRSDKPKAEQSDINDRKLIEKDIDEEVNDENMGSQEPMEDDEQAMLREDQPNEELINRYLQQDSQALNGNERSYNFKSKEDNLYANTSQDHSIRKNNGNPEEFQKSYHEPFAEESKFVLNNSFRFSHYDD